MARVGGKLPSRLMIGQYVPSLYLDFRENFGRGQSGLLTATRNSVCNIIGANGVLGALPVNGFGPTHRPYKPLGLTLEGAATQLETAPNDITNAFWQNIRSTDASNTATAPDGTVTADTLIEDATASASHYVRHTHTKAASAVTYTVSRFVKAKERTKCAIITDDDAIAGAVAYFDLDAGVVGTTSAGVFSDVTSGIVPYANGWYRVWMTFKSNTATKLNIGLGITTSLSSLTYSGDGASGIYVWGQNAVASAVLTSPILTAGTRAATVANVAFSPANPAMITVYVEVIAPDLFSNSTIPISGYGRLIFMNDGTYNNNLDLVLFRYNRSARLSIHSAGVTEFNYVLDNAWLPGVVTRVAASVGPNFKAIATSVAPTGSSSTSSFNSALAMSSIGLGRDAIGVNSWVDGALGKLQVIDKTSTLEELRRMVTS